MMNMQTHNTRAVDSLFVHSRTAPNPFSLFPCPYLHFLHILSHKLMQQLLQCDVPHLNPRLKISPLSFQHTNIMSSCKNSKSSRFHFQDQVTTMGQETRKLSDEYEVSEILGRGGFSVVRKGTRKSSSGKKTHVAIKTLRRLGPSSANNPSSHGGNKSMGLSLWRQVSVSDALLTNEILVMRKLVENVSPHPNVIELYDVCEDSNGVHLVLELCSGGELFDRIVAIESYTEERAAAVVRQIAEGLDAIHRANIVHRDLKPENCLFLDSREDAPLKIMDFGLSSVEEFTDPVVGLFGSIDYVSPEALSQGKITTKSDMWSLGVILYILLSG